MTFHTTGEDTSWALFDGKIKYENDSTKETQTGLGLWIWIEQKDSPQIGSHTDRTIVI